MSEEKAVKKPHKKVFYGTVTSNKNDKTIVVRVETKIKHPMYKKFVKRSKKFKAHDNENTCNVGDYVKIIECRPLSRHKKWRLAEVVKRTEEVI
jgi:small subunit ribosomal protein S17